MPRLFNITNHNLTPAQVNDAIGSLGVTEVVDLPADLKKTWGQIPTKATYPEVRGLLDPLFDFMHANITREDFILCAGSRTAQRLVDQISVVLEATDVESCTERRSVEKTLPDGIVKKDSVFEHVQYRQMDNLMQRVTVCPKCVTTCGI